jgi:glycosyltransferase involved in cell wall biosynthesis
VKVAHFINKNVEYSGLANVANSLNREMHSINGISSTLIDSSHKIYQGLSTFFSSTHIVVHGFFHKYFLLLFFARIFTNKSFYIICHGQLTYNSLKRSKIIKIYMKFIMAILGNSVYAQYLNVKEYDESIKYKKYFICGNGVDSLEYIHKEFCSPIRIFFIGRVTYQKGLHLFLDKYKNLDKKIKNKFELSIYGPIDSSYKEIKKFLNNKDFDNCFKGPVMGEDKIQAFVENDIFLLPSIFEGEPIAFLEASSYSKICICSKEINTDINESQNFTFFIEDGLSEILKKLTMLKKKDIEYMQSASHSYSLKRSWQNITTNLINVYKNKI